MRRLWQQLQKWFPDYGNLLYVEPQLIIFGNWDDDKLGTTPINHMILLFKRYIYFRKNGQNDSDPHSLTAFIKTIEQHRAEERDKLNFHCRT